MINPVRNKPLQAAAAVPPQAGERISNGMKFQYIDVHTHVQFAAYDNDRNEVIERALENGVAMVNVGTQKDTSHKAIELAKRHENLWATVGLHPIHTSKSFHDEQELGAARLDPASLSRSEVSGFWSRREEFDYDYYKNLAQDSKVVAIGECGLDYAAFVRERSERLQKRASAEANSGGGLQKGEIELRKEKQKEVFIKQIELAYELKKPLMIHCRDAFADLIEILNFKFKILNSPPGIIHFFSGDKEEAQKLLAMGFYFTFGGVITFPPKAGQPRADTRDYDEVIRMIPLDRILSETDAPYVAPVPYRGKRNEPLFVVEVVKKLAEIKNVSVEEMAGAILGNASLIFGLKLASL